VNFGEIVIFPEIGCAPTHPPLAKQAVAFVDDHERVNG